MRTPFSRLLRLSVALLAGAVLAPGVYAQDYKIESFDSAAPAELAPAIRETLSNAAVRVIGPQGPLCEIWFRTAVPARASAQQTLGVAYGQFEEGTLFGAVRFLRETRDFRKQLVKPGVFTLRYALNPVDGDHMGVSPIRDFLLLLPATEDVNPASFTRDDTIKLSKKAIGVNHPSVWSITSGEGEHAKLPEVIHLEEEDAWVLFYRISVQPAGGAAAPLTLGLIVVGHAPEA
ncbi:MAG: hypothetical protein M1453_03470 [Acidobacteria bacterium]|nr:hypothetical protein [Acidobacteriota bacterium]MCL5287039.1 hypothetical protein [Acidobacteriota bacterium]